MTTTPDPTTVREIAEDAMRSAIRDDMFWQVNQAVIEHGVPGPASKGSTFEAHRNAAIAEYKRMAAALDRPDGQPRDERDAEIAKLRADLAEMTRCRNAAIAYAERQYVPIELDDEIDIDGEELASRIEGELLGPGWDWEDDRTPGLLAKQAVAVIRPHLARLTDQAQKARKAAQTEQPQDDGDPCAVCYCRGCRQCVNPMPPSEVCFCMKAMRPVTADTTLEASPVPLRKRPIPDQLDYFSEKLAAQINPGDVPREAIIAMGATIVGIGAIATELRKQATATSHEQPQDDGDVRAVAALLAACDNEVGAADDAVARAMDAVEDRFADRIAALEARDAKTGEQR